MVYEDHWIPVAATSRPLQDRRRDAVSAWRMGDDMEQVDSLLEEALAAAARGDFAERDRICAQASKILEEARARRKGKIEAPAVILLPDRSQEASK